MTTRPPSSIDGPTHAAPVEPLEALLRECAEDHVALRAILEELDALLDLAVVRHSAQRPELVPLAEVFSDFRAELVRHMRREERGLFGLARSLSGPRPVPLPPVPLRSAPPLSRMAAEHAALRAELRAMRQIARDYSLPPDAEPDLVRLYACFEILEREIVHHVRTEDERLVPALVEQIDPAG